MTLLPEPLTPETFAPFGTVIETGESERFAINDGTAIRHHRLAAVDPGEDGTAIISIVRARRWPVRELVTLERHPLSTQAIMPLSSEDWMVVVASGERPTAADCHLFHAFGDQGVQFAPGVWHHPLLIYAQSQEFLVIDREEPGRAPETIDLDPPALLPGG